MKNRFNLSKTIHTSLLEYLNENSNNIPIINSKYLDDLKAELSAFKTDEELLRSGGISNKLLDRIAFGFYVDDIQQLMPSELKIKWVDDLDNVEWEIKQSGLSNIKWASKINLSEPIDVSYWEDEDHERGFYIEDGHHRYMAAKILNKPLNIELEIKINPIKTISTNLGYDELHRYIFKKFKE